MKTIRLFFLLFWVLLTVNLYSQYDPTTIYTYNQTGVSAGDFTGDDFNWFWRWYWRNYFENNYNGLVYEAEATYEYNCHFFAWFKTEQYSASRYWVDYPDNNWYDYSFVRTSSEHYPGKVTYSFTDGTLDHSAVTTSTSGRYRSKWGPYCVFIHDYDECPYYQEGANVRKYYSRFEISGPNLLSCESGHYTILSITDQGYSITWSTDSYLDLESYGNDYANTYPLDDGNGTLTANIYKSGLGSAHDEDFSIATMVSPPNAPEYIDLADNLCRWQYIGFSCDVAGNPYNTSYDWNISTEINANIYYGQGTNYVQIYSYDVGDVTMSVSAYNQCGYSDYFYSDPYYIDDCFFKMNLSPNPATDFLKVELSDVNQPSATVEIFNTQAKKVMSSTLTGKETTLNVSKLQKGIYYLTVTNKGKLRTMRFIKE